MSESFETEEESSIVENWSLYFPFDDYSADLAWVKAVSLFRSFLSSSGCGSSLLEGVDLEKATEVVFDYRVFCSLIDSESSLGAFPSVLKNNAAMTLQCLGLALCSMRKRRRNNKSEGGIMTPLSNKINARFVQFRPMTAIRKLKSSHLGKYVAVRGNVVRVSGVRPLVKRMDFTCSKCEELITKSMPDGRFQPPTHCENSECKAKLFRAEKPSAVTVDYQQIRLQEIDEANTSGNAGAVPRTIDVELTEELVDLVVPGDVVTVTGVVKALNSESLTGRGKRAKGKNKESSLLVMVLEANAIETKTIVSGHSSASSSSASNNTGETDHERSEDEKKSANKRSLQTSPRQEIASSSSQDSAISFLADRSERGKRQKMEKSILFQGVSDTSLSKQKNDVVANLSDKDYEMIHTVAKNFDFSFLVYSLCPLILGNEQVKAGLLLGLAGGTNGHVNEKNTVPIRADIHVLVVGDPGLGKSQMLKAAAAVSPRGVYVCGNTTTKSGLTVTMAKDQNGEHSLEAGALVLADRGVCCIDEFDKMTCEHAALLEAMEQQSISVAKAGIVCTLSARTSILAAANPIKGHYDRNRTILENLKMSSPLLSRFDLVFILVDKPNTDRDETIADYVVDLHLAQAGSSSSQTPALSQSSKGRAGKKRNKMGNKRRRRDDETFQAYLADRVKDYADPLPADMLRKYIAFAKHYCHPKLSVPACKILQSFYMELRQKGSLCDSTPITTRQLESLIRLAQARAKLELRDLVTEQDAKDIVSLMRESLFDAFTDEAGVIDMTRSTGMSSGKIIKKLADQLVRVARQRGDPNFTLEQIKVEAKRINVLHLVEDIRDTCRTLNEQCYLLVKGPNKYRLPSGWQG